jgi:hypothetical protein
MKSVARLFTMAAAVLVSACSGGGGGTPETAQSVMGLTIPGDETTADAGAPGTFVCSDRSGVAAYCADQGITPDAGGKVHVVCINDFSYYPSIVVPRQGDVVAWVNVEKCADPNGPPVNTVEGLFADVLGSGCDTHHEVVTAPDESTVNAADTLSARLCSRFPSIPAKPGTPAVPLFGIDPGACPGHLDQSGNDKLPLLGDQTPKFQLLVTPTNVFCHKFADVGTQHYTCFTNPAHAVALHGGIVVLPAQAPEIPDLPQEPQF